MTDLVVFVGIVALVAVAGMLAGIIIAGRIDRILQPPSAPETDDKSQDQEDHP